MRKIFVLAFLSLFVAAMSAQTDSIKPRITLNIGAGKSTKGDSLKNIMTSMDRRADAMQTNLTKAMIPYNAVVRDTATLPTMSTDYMKGNYYRHTSSDVVRYYFPTMGYVDFLDNATGTLPSQTGNAGRILSTDGTNPVWLYTDTINILIDGQSNSIGQQAQTPPTYTQPNLKVWNGSAWIAPTLGVAPFNVNGANNAGLQFALKLARQRPQSFIRLIANGNSGQPISYWNTTPFTGFTSTNSVVTAAIGSTSTIDAMIWIQGESDYFRTKAQYIDDYYQLRARWLSTTWYKNTTKHINVGIYLGANGFQDATLREIGSDSTTQTSYANTFGLAVYDGIHWTNASLDTIGKERIWNAYLSTPYDYKNVISGSVSGTDNTVLKKSGSSTADSRITDVTNVIVTDAVKENVLTIRSNADSTAPGQIQNTLYFDGRFNSGTALASSDAYSDASISSVKESTNGNGGTLLRFRTSSVGAGGMQWKADLDMAGNFNVLNGFKINSLATNKHFLVGDGTKFSGRLLAQQDIYDASGVGNGGFSANQICFGSSIYNMKGSSRFTVSDGVLATITINGGDGSSGTNGGYFMLQKDGSNRMLVGSESAALGGTGNGGLLYVYGANPLLVYTNAVKRFTVNADGTAVVGASAITAGAQFEVQSTTGGVLFPRMTTTQRDAIASPANGLVLYNTTTDKLQVRAAGAWVDLH